MKNEHFSIDQNGFQIIADILSYNMRPLFFFMSVFQSVTYVTFFHKVHFKCVCEAYLSLCGLAPHKREICRLVAVKYFLANFIIIYSTESLQTSI